MASAKERAKKSLDEASANLNKAIAALTGATLEGLMDASQMIIDAAERKVPREYGFLAASKFVRRAQNNPNAVEIGFSADYAAYVHENLDQKLKGEPRPSGIGHYWGPSGEPRFLANTVNRNHQPILEVLKRRGARALNEW